MSNPNPPDDNGGASDAPRRHVHRKPPRRLSLVDLHANTGSERSRKSPALDSGFILSDAPQSNVSTATPARSPTFSYVPRFNALHSPSPASPCFQRGPSASPSTPTSPMPSPRVRQSTSSQYLGRSASRKEASNLDSASTSVDNHSAPRSPFTYSTSASWNADFSAPQSSQSQSYDQQHPVPRAMLLTSASSGSLRGVRRKHTYRHTRGRSDSSSNVKSPVAKSTGWSSRSSANGRPNSELSDTSPSAGEESPFRRGQQQTFRAAGLASKRSSGSVARSDLGSVTSDAGWTTATTAVDAASGISKAIAPPERDGHQHRGDGEGRAIDHVDAIPVIPSADQNGTPATSQTDHQPQRSEVPHSAISTPSNDTSLTGSFATGRESRSSVEAPDGTQDAHTPRATDTTFRADDVATTQASVPPTSIRDGQTHPATWSAAADHRAAALESLAEVVSNVSESLGTGVRSPVGLGIQGSLNDGMPVDQHDRRGSASSTLSSASLPLGFGQSLRGHFANQPTASALFFTTDEGSVADQEWLRTQNDSPSPSDSRSLSQSGQGRPSTRGTLGYDQIDAVPSLDPDHRSWYRHQANDSVVSSVMPFPVDVGGSSDGHASQPMHRADREYLYGLSTQEAHSSKTRGNSNETYRPAHASGRRQRSSEPLLPPPSLIRPPSAGENNHDTRLHKRLKRWSDIISGARENAARPQSTSPPGNQRPQSGRSSRASRHSIHSLMAGPPHGRFRRLSAGINTTDDTSPLSFFDGRHSQRPSPPVPLVSNMVEARALEKRSDWYDQPIRMTATTSQTAGPPAPHSPDLFTQQRQALHHRLTSETLRDTLQNGSAAPAPSPRLVSSLLLPQQLDGLDENVPRWARSESPVFHGLWRTGFLLSMLALPLLWYVFEAGFLYHAVSPAVIFISIPMVVAACCSYLAIATIDPGRVPTDLHPEPWHDAIDEKELHGPQPGNLAVEEDPAIAALDKDSPKRKMALEKLREQLLKAAASPNVAQDQQQEGERLPDSHLEAARRPREQRKVLHSPPSVRDLQTRNWQHAFDALDTPGISPKLGPSAPPTSPVTPKIRARSARTKMSSPSLQSLRPVRTTSRPEVIRRRAEAPPSLSLPTFSGGLGIDIAARDSTSSAERGNQGTVDAAGGGGGATTADVAAALTTPRTPKGATPRKLVRLDIDDRHATWIPVSWCAVCRSFPPPRTVHCQATNRCVADFQYYSRGLGREIGRGNLFLSVLLLASSVFCLAYIAVFSAVMLASLSRWDSKHATDGVRPRGVLFYSGPYDSFNSALRAAPVAGILFVSSIVVLLAFLLPDLCRQMNVSCRAQTMPQRRRHKSMVKELSARLDDVGGHPAFPCNPYDIGHWTSNLRREMFPAPLASQRGRGRQDTKDEEANVRGRNPI